MKIALYGGPYDGADFEVLNVNFSEIIMVGRLPNKLDILVLGNLNFYRELVSSVALSPEQIISLAKSLQIYEPIEIIKNTAKLQFCAEQEKPKSFFSRCKAKLKTKKYNEHKR